ncbi:dirigent protein 4-like [Mercurialis annua]|uniref:dirigent protein 4-like n=1 Tax=Mercurialis annua TaxID=3986 RepID=UPI002160B34B|nr:dirigent protein 4-like [Mercurialis annua]
MMMFYVCSANDEGDYYSETKYGIVMKKKMTKINFFYHYVSGGENPNVVRIAQANATRNESNPFPPFGDLNAINNALRVGIEPNSRIIGRAKGLEVEASQGNEMPTAVVYLDFGFTTGELNGSSFVICSRDLYLEPIHELAVVGGRGNFRMAEGFAKVELIFFNPTDGYGVDKYCVNLYHH